MTPESVGLEVSIIRKIHEGLTLDVSLSLGRSRGVIFGESGAGKTTLLRLIAGLERPDSGSVRVQDSIWFDSSMPINKKLRLRGVGMIFQDDLLFPHLSVEANIRFGLVSMSRSEVDRRLEQVATLCEVAHLLKRRPETLSGGERQRVGLARAIAPRPKLLLCDEPISAIDFEGRFALLDRLREVQIVEQIPMLYVTHSPAEAIAFGEVLFRLEAGNVVDRGFPLDVLARRVLHDSRSSRLENVRNLLRGVIAGHSSDRGETFVLLEGGPTLVVPFADREVGSPATISIRADDVLLARGLMTGLSARNVIAGQVARLVVHGGDVEVLARTGTIEWIVSVVGPAATELGLCQGAEVYLIFKARSCHVLPA